MAVKAKPKKGKSKRLTQGQQSKLFIESARTVLKDGDATAFDRAMNAIVRRKAKPKGG